MADTPAEKPVVAGDSQREQDLGTFLLNRLAVHKQELEVDKMFRAVVKLEGSDLHLPSAARHWFAPRVSCALSRGPIDAEEMVRLLVPMMDARNQRIFRETGGADFSHSCSVDGTRVAISRQCADPIREHRTRRPAHQQLDSGLRRPVSASGGGTVVPLRSGAGAPGRRHRFRENDDHRVDAELYQSQVPEAHPHTGRSRRIHFYATTSA